MQTKIYAALAAVAAYALAPTVVPLLAGRGFAPSVPLFRVTSLSIFGAGLGTVMTPQWVARGYFLRVTALSLGTGALSIVANFVLIPRYGMLASAWVTVISYTVIMLANLVFIWWLQTRPR